MQVSDAPFVMAGATAAAAEVFPSSGRELWPGVPLVRVWGEFAPGELRAVSHERGGLVLIGECLENDVELRAGLQLALRSGQPDALGRWRGAYTCLLFAGAELHVLVDVAGQFPVFYAPVGGHLVVSSRLRPLAALRDAQVDPLVFAAQLMLLDWEELRRGRSWFAGIARLGGARALRVTATGSCERTYEPLVPRRALSFDDAASSVRDALQSAVGLRMFGAHRPTGYLSGGVDSSTIAFLAAQQGQLKVFTSHYPPADAGDVVPARALARLDSELIPNEIVRSAATLPFSQLPAFMRSDEPNRLTTILARVAADVEPLMQARSDVHFTGEGGDALFAASPDYLASLASTRHLGRLLRESTALAHAMDEAPAAVLRDTLLLAGRGLHGVLTRLAHDLRNATELPPSWQKVDGWQSPGSTGGWLTQRMRAQLAEAVASVDFDPALADVGIADRVAIAQVHRSGETLRHLRELAGGRLRLTAPYLDGAPIRAALMLPAHERARSYKGLLREAMRGIVPPQALDRPGHETKTNYAKELYLGLEANADRVFELFKDSRLADLGVLEPSAVECSLADGVRGHDPHFANLNQLIASELWLRGLP